MPKMTKFLPDIRLFLFQFWKGVVLSFFFGNLLGLLFGWGLSAVFWVFTGSLLLAYFLTVTCAILFLALVLTLGKTTPDE